ncbi:hypothetical protein DICPUDRAFT_148893 [Dictyostelium purpureum]|uniref:CS domain-containing protein n=1 Tax=Dictyostelium purpureum TaxID=5786 RepID=F0ZCA0_DICPU|nr:uncharacterized protein DICPUDRAFT_148893 [Dictyostelium purpureum]EGC38410.1 hypothetical protein DICPUDRAFT_148893 [Dictyostelium purpureum]|eukprot:XP_003285071.1 hypothetical protein DICPUDRAFT_148893 [Dictyostelium purpureum]
MTTTMKCGNNGCGKEFTAETIDQCCYHPGQAVFHEGLKGWSCCKKRVTDFDEFLGITGCTTGTHKVAEPKAASKPIVQSTTTSDVTGGVVEQKKETHAHPSDKFMPKPIKVDPNSTNANTTAAPKQFIKLPEYVEENDPEDAVIPEGAQCCRNSCKAFYKDESSRTEECHYHPGEPVFHEGSKGWSCCKPKAAIFEEFLKIKGCKTGKHKFIPPPKDESKVECRHDWYQQFDAIIMTIYAKNVDKVNSKIQFVDNQTISVELKLPNEKSFKKVYELAGTIDTAKSNFMILSTKVEFKLIKDPQESWSRLEKSELDLYRYQV